MAKQQKQVLGRGIAALLKDPDKDITMSEGGSLMAFIAPNSIEVNPFQPRTTFDEQALSELAQSIEQLGIIQPITVRKVENGSFQLVSGERRLRAALLANLERVPVYIKEASDQESLEMALVENIQRQELDPIEIALSYQRLIDEIQLTQDKLSKRVGKQRSTITNYLRLLKLHPQVQDALKNRSISMGHGRAIMSLENHPDQLQLLGEVLGKGLSVRATENRARQIAQPKSSKPTNNLKLSKKAASAVEALQHLSDKEVSVDLRANGSGVLKFHFESEKDLLKLKKALIGE
jgi:ParB family chromosome partitioning protein